MSRMDDSIFSNLKVIELASVLAGPSVGQFFAELGAEVIKVENPHTNGDVTRSWKSVNENTEDVSAYFSCVNWGKKSVLLDISLSEELEILYALIKEADIVIVSYKPGDAIKLKVDYDRLRKINPSLIYGEISGYGALSNRVGYDAIIQAEVGFMYLNSEQDSDPIKIPVALMDLLAGHQLKEALLIGYIKFLKTQKGGKYSVSLIESGLASLANQATNYLVADSDPKPKGSLHPNIAPYGEMFETLDKRLVVLAIGSDKQFNALLKVLDLEHLKEYNTNIFRVKNRKSIAVELGGVIKSIDSKELMNQFNNEHIPAGIINKVSEAIDLYGSLMKLEDNSGLRGLRTFIAQINNNPNSSHILPPPKLGEHTDEVIQNL